MVKAHDFERQMLFLAVQFTHDGKLRPLLLTVLTALYDTLADSDETSTPEEMDMQASIILRYVPFIYQQCTNAMPWCLSQVYDSPCSRDAIGLRRGHVR